MNATFVQVEFWNLVGLLLAFFACVGTFGAVLLSQFEKRLGEKFKSQELARKTSEETLQKLLDAHIADEKQHGNALQVLERDFLKFQADLPLHYVRREDYVRGQSVIEAKLDALYNKLEVVQIKGAQNNA